VAEVCDDKGLVVGSLALYPDAVAARAIWVEVRRRVDAHVYLIALVSYQPETLGILLVDVVNEAICECVSYRGVYPCC
jgi:hypothetical protein